MDGGVAERGLQIADRGLWNVERGMLNEVRVIRTFADHPRGTDKIRPNLFTVDWRVADCGSRIAVLLKFGRRTPELKSR